MTVFFLIYSAISLTLLVILNIVRGYYSEGLEPHEKQMFTMMDERPILFHTIFLVTSPILFCIVLLATIAEKFSKEFKS